MGILGKERPTREGFLRIVFLILRNFCRTFGKRYILKVLKCDLVDYAIDSRLIVFQLFHMNKFPDIIMNLLSRLVLAIFFSMALVVCARAQSVVELHEKFDFSNLNFSQ